VSTPVYSSGSVTVPNTTFTGGNGAIYWGLSTSSASTPSVEQLFNCQDGSGGKLLDCRRQEFANNQVHLTYNIDWLRSAVERSWLFHIPCVLCANQRLPIQTGQHIIHCHNSDHVSHNHVGLPSNRYDSTVDSCTAYVIIRG
jgi:hypothetical protein